jgi:hypothetical protein
MTDHETMEAINRLIAQFALRVEPLRHAATAKTEGAALARYLRGVADHFAAAVRADKPERVRELFFSDGTPAKVHLCTTCEMLFDLPEDATCCEPKLCACGAPRREHRLDCEACHARDMTAAEAARWAAAKERSAAGYDDPVYVLTADGHGWGAHDGHVSSLEWLRDSVESWHFDHPGDALPGLHVYATKARRMKFHADSLIENAVEDLYDDAIDDLPREGEAALQALLDAWSNTYSPTGYDPDLSTKLVGWEAAEGA